MRKLLIGLRLSSFLTVFCGYLGLVTTSRYPVGTLAIPLLLFALAPVGEWVDRRFVRYRTASSFVSIMYVAASMLLIPFMNLLANVVNLVIFIQAYAFLHKKRPRDYIHLMLMSFFLMLAASVLMPEPEIGLVMLLFLLCAIVTMVLLQIITASENAAANGRADLVRLDETEPESFDSRPRLDLGVVNSVSGISVATIMVAIILFISIPRMEAGLLGRDDMSLYRMGVSQTVDLAQGGLIMRTSAPVMRVEFPDEPGGRFGGPMFWRSSSLDEYDDPQWKRKGLTSHPHLDAYSLTAREIFDSVNLRSERISRIASPGKRVVRQVVYTQNAPSDGVPALTLVRAIEASSDNRGVVLLWDRMSDHSILLNRPTQRWLQYEALSEIEQHKPEQLRAAPDNYQTVMSERDYKLLTHNTLQQRSRELVAQITEGKTNPYDKVVAIAAYLSQGAFTYTLNVPSLPQRQPVDMFLHAVRTGHCELFASAMALMVRNLGIPARVVSGYRGAEWSELDRAYTIREDMAHLWVEVYFIGYGWVTFDPSPPSAQLANMGGGRLTRFLSRQALVARMLWYRNVVTFNTGMQLAVLQNVRGGVIGLREGFSGLDSPTASPFRPGAALIIMPAALVLLIAALVWGVVAWARTASSTKYPLSADQARAVKLYKMLVRKLERAGVRCNGLSAEEINKTVKTTHPYAMPATESVVNTYNEVRFGDRTLGPEPYRELKRTIKTASLAKPTPGGE